MLAVFAGPRIGLYFFVRVGFLIPDILRGGSRFAF